MRIESGDDLGLGLTSLARQLITACLKLKLSTLRRQPWGALHCRRLWNDGTHCDGADLGNRETA